ncbi:uncharacterized protein LOC117327146 isoform X2 [Pecten maximus]|uniref:uncharacterized protein LOC117327146 isoform X2 n=1 Tax=Pecten maximus TaxID=6579 RepID=UPI0014582723|nr:uncharacterized protein LOC117327146 isoform X2 [Pecten maximus]
MAATDHDGIDGVSTVSNTQSCIIRRAVLPIPTHQEKSDSTYETKGTKEWTKHETKQFLCEHHTMNHTARSVRMYPRVVSLDRRFITEILSMYWAVYHGDIETSLFWTSCSSCTEREVPLFGLWIHKIRTHGLSVRVRAYIGIYKWSENRRIKTFTY